MEFGFIQVRELVKENAILRDKMTTLKEYLVATESEQQSNRDKMIDMINEHSSITRLTGDLDILTQVRRRFARTLQLR